MKHTSSISLPRRLTALVLAAVLTLPIPVSASAGIQKLQTARSIADGLDFFNTITIHPESGRTESYLLEFDPDGSVIPIMVQGSGTIYAAASINKAVETAQNMGYHVLAAVNTDFFSYATGVPMGIVIEDGVYKSSPEGRPAIAIEDREFSLLETPEVTLTLTHKDSDQDITVHHLNKWRSAYGGLYLLNEYFSTVSTRTSTSGWMVRMEELDGDELTVSGKLRLKVTELIQGSDPVSIGEGEYILTADDASGMNDIFELFQVGDRLTLTTECTDTALKDAQWACGTGDIMVQDGELLDPESWEFTEKGRDPRTALGVRRDGTVVMYVVDGRKSGYSGGLSQLDLAEEMKAQDCEWAVNLDGGGSSAMSVWIPGITAPGVVNLPSDGKPRGCATYLLFAAKKEGDGNPDRLALKRDGLVVLTGTSVDLGDVVVMDNGLNPLEYVAEDLTIRSADDLGTIEEGRYTAGDEIGTDTLNLRSRRLGIRGTGQIHIVDELTELTLTQAETGEPVTSIVLKPEKELSLNANGSYYSRVAMRDQSGVVWTVEGDVGTVTEDGTFIAASEGGLTGSLTALAGGLSITVPVRLMNLHLDIDENHWAYEAVEYCYEQGLVSGLTNTEFGPDANIRRGDFLLMLYRAAGSPEVTSLPDFPDVAPTDYYAAAIAWAQENGLASGMEDGTFAPNINVTREQAFTILNRALPLLNIFCVDAPVEILDRFADRDQISSWAQQHAATLVAYQIVGGSSDQLSPRVNLSRVDMAAILYKIGTFDPSESTPILPESPEEPEGSSDTTEEPEAPDTSDTIEEPEAPDTSDTTEEPEAPDTSDDSVTGMTLSHSDVTLQPGEAFRLSAIFFPEGAQGNVVWTTISDIPNVTAIAPDGTVTNLNTTGEPVVLKVTGSCGSFYASCIVRCRPAQNAGMVNEDVEMLNVRSGPETTFEPVDKIPGGTGVMILEETENNWLEVQYLTAAGGVGTGYVSGDYVTRQ